jgi:BirA family biotin operon repressor/biotin-[acetyl-CoA-carboxylase] ligase
MQSVSDTTQNWAGQRGITINFSAETGSTNDNAKNAALKENGATLIELTDHQTKGRGRGINHWLDTGAGESLLCTWSLKPPGAPQAITAPRIGLAICLAASGTWPSLPWSLKAPNDLLLGGKKCAGLLVETVSDGQRHRLLIGLGFNILNHPRKFNEATHLSEALGRAPEDGEWFRFLDQLKQEIEASLPDICKPELTESARSQLVGALNANPNGGVKISQISPRGDLIHAGGTIPWSDI